MDSLPDHADPFVILFGLFYMQHIFPFTEPFKNIQTLTSVYISHVTVMNVVYSEGRHLKESGVEYSRSNISCISQDTLIIESNGL